ncbi:MAG: 4Fe-4S dicluster domain-containing protein, partial [Anaerolineae bacterium]|nr:4Fe-4S dicluster domain-containing protein [Anaerolineae bacterium]
VPELALRFVLSNPDVSVALSGMSTMRHVVENVATASDASSLSDDERQVIEQHLERLKRMADLYCSGCKYCLPCPQEVNIPRVFQIYNEARVYGLWERARHAYANWGESSGGRADACVQCGQCEEKCPQRIPIREQLAGAHAALISGR